MLKLSQLALATLLGATTSHANASDIDAMQTQLDQLQQQMQQLQKQLADEKAKQAQMNEKLEKQDETIAKQAQDNADSAQSGVKFGGAIRTNYSHTSYDDGNRNRGGDFDFDLFRVNVSGDIGGVLIGGEIRFFDYMTAIKSAWAGYQFTDDWQVQVGVTKVPFGNDPYNSHNYFFSANYYVGLEDDHDLGVMFKRKVADNWQLDLGFFKNDELGGVDGYVEDRSHRYSYDIVGSRTADEGIYAEPTAELGEYNTFTGRYAYFFEHGEGMKTEVGFSALAGGLHDGQDRAGSYNAWALHVNSNINSWNIQLQHGEYDYNIDDTNRIAVGAYAFYDSVAADATMSSLNIAYSLPVEWGPVSNLQFYNDYSAIYDKSDNSADTWMNVTGVSIAAGGLFTYVDYALAKNQPFVGGSVAGDSDETEGRFNINIGYYF
ncbi:OprO/OprP family phosphate-selective porin [Pseudoalteromonas shioyasakiensis]|uniref:OprO/OprP family phosphate-selective porin n=1 Tax=Pseudoalteromonas shioyasakiensis TaxID=1190813 RepID=UPI0021190F03|nr:OprO/OprP family phosphate-selective porin [Pseudoalteromonas shioyasakiensis]MCQ8879718.1 OprO/OprP family phosphate-selective porin [Pseudoalteromonas shioyasakiensis]